MDFKVEWKGLPELIKNMDDLAKQQVPFALSQAINKTSYEKILPGVGKKMQSSLDRPTPYTTNSIRYKKATKNNPSAIIKFKDKSDAGKGNPAANFMLPQVAGGSRSVKRFESALQRIGVLPKGMFIAPGDACPLDAYGNIPGSFIVQILSYFRAFGEQGYRANITDKKKAALAKGSKRKGTMGYEYFVSYGKGTKKIKKTIAWFKNNKNCPFAGCGQSFDTKSITRELAALEKDIPGQLTKGIWSGLQHLPAGIYKRVGFAKGRSAIKPIMMFVKDPSYQKRFPFCETVQDIVNQNLPGAFDEAMKSALLTAKRTG